MSLLDDELSADALQCKKDWFTFNGGKATADTASTKAHKKPLFFDIALNYVQLDMERLQERAGKPPASASDAVNETPRNVGAGGLKSATSEKKPPEPERKTTSLVGKTAKVEAADRERAPTPEHSSQAARGGLGSLLGGWWGRK